MVNKLAPYPLGVQSDRVIMHVDIDYFFAQCEEIANPLLKDKPVVVCVYSGRSEDSGAVSTANYIARKYGVKSGMPIAFAKRALKGIDSVFLPVNRGLYEDISQRVMGILRNNADVFEQESIDEAYLDVSERAGGDFGSAQMLAHSIKGEIRRVEKLTCSVGIGPNKVVAKMSSDYGKPDGLMVIRKDEVKTFLDPLPVDKLYGVGRKTTLRLKELGVSTIGELAGYDAEGLKRIFGEKLGSYFHLAANGIYEEPVRERAMAEQISRIVTLKQDTRDPAIIFSELERICLDVRSRLIEEGLLYRSVGIVAIATNLEIRSRMRTLEHPSEDLEPIVKTARELLSKFLDEEREVLLRRFGVKISGLSRKAEQGSLTKFF